MLILLLGVAIAFSVVMLLLSLLVTTLCQSTQALLKIRGRNLQSAIRSLFQSEFDLPKWAANQHAAALLNSPQIALLNQRKDPDQDPIQNILLQLGRKLDCGPAFL